MCERTCALKLLVRELADLAVIGRQHVVHQLDHADAHVLEQLRVVCLQAKQQFCGSSERRQRVADLQANSHELDHADAHILEQLRVVRLQARQQVHGC